MTLQLFFLIVAPPPQRRTRAEMMKHIDADYYGYRDDDDGVLIPLEKARSEQLEKEALENWLANKGNEASLEKEEEDIYAVNEEPMVINETCSSFLIINFFK